jgi:DNA-binding NarL/FixJ family response regulator
MTEIKYIAVVDDHILIRKGLCALINHFPSYKVLFDTDNGKDMIEMINPQQLPDVVLLDINMPKMDGYATARWLKINFPEIKVLVLSIMDSEDAIIKMIRQGARGYVLKDHDPMELKKALDNVVESGYHCNDAITHALVSAIANDTQNDEPEAGYENITARELEFLQLACSEKTYREIATEMLVSERTIEGYRDSLFKKLQVTSRIGLIILAIRKNLVHI